jgi:hypothetical protein
MQLLQALSDDSEIKSCRTIFDHAWGSENFCSDEFINVQTSYSPTFSLAQSLQAELAMTPSTLGKHFPLPSAYAIPCCNARADSSNGQRPLDLSHHVIGTYSCQ